MERGLRGAVLREDSDTFDEFKLKFIDGDEYEKQQQQTPAFLGRNPTSPDADHFEPVSDFTGFPAPDSSPRHPTLKAGRRPTEVSAAKPKG